MLRNLPDNLKGIGYPFTVTLEVGMCVALHFNGGMIRRGIVHADPKVTSACMWWEQLSHRKYRSQNPKISTLEHGLEQCRLTSALTIEPVSFFDSWLSRVPLPVRRSFGWVYMRPSRASTLPRKIQCRKKNTGEAKAPRKIRVDKGKHQTPFRKTRCDKGVKKKKSCPCNVVLLANDAPGENHETSLFC